MLNEHTIFRKDNVLCDALLKKRPIYVTMVSRLPKSGVKSRG